MKGQAFCRNRVRHGIPPRQKLGFDNAHMIYNGPIKEKEIFNSILLDSGYINIDSTEEPIWLEELSAAYPQRNFLLAYV